jgi:hypothetical protein
MALDVGADVTYECVTGTYRVVRHAVVVGVGVMKECVAETYLVVRHAVVVEVGAGRETFSTDVTLMRLLPGVDPAVSVQGTGRAERLPALHTRVGLLSWNTQRHIRIEYIT